MMEKIAIDIDANDFASVGDQFREVGLEAEKNVLVIIYSYEESVKFLSFSGLDSNL